ncbi:DUF4149 domain-containing protein [Candidatus Puniceispirillum sp.]|nr:DUF4149 domain-containing protein [Candidatus Puniceispirillum sp.]
MISTAVIFHTAIIGFMVFFSAVVAHSVFKTLSQEAAGAFLRVLFPRMFIFGLILSLMASTVAAYEGIAQTALLSVFVSTGFALNAFVVTPIINKQRDAMLEGDDIAGKKFKQFHFVSVAIFLVQLITSSYIVVTSMIHGL